MTNQAACGFYERLGGTPILERQVPIGAPVIEVDEIAYGFEL